MSPSFPDGPSDDRRRQADLDWLYGDERPSIDRTRVLEDSEIAELERRRAAAQPSADEVEHAATTGAQAARQAGRDADRERARVVHREDVVLRENGVAPGASAPDGQRRSTPSGASRSMAADVPRPRPRPAAQPAARPVAPAPRPLGATAQPAPPRTSRSSERRRPRWVRWLVTALAAWLVWLVVVPMVALARSPRVDERPAADRPAQQPGTTTLLVGSDQRDDLTPEQRKKLGTGSEVGKRTDTMMLLFQPTSGKPVLLSLPRDSYVSIPGHGHNKLNAAYALGGPQLLVQTVEQDTGLRVDNYMEVGFDGFSNVVDALGGITMCLDAPMKDKDAHVDLPAGCQTLAGPQALGYVRMRKSDPTGDLGRMKRQRQMIAAIVKKAASPMTFINPVRYWRLTMAGGQAVTRGHDTGATDLLGVVRAMRTVSGCGTCTLAVPISNADASTAAGSSVIWDEAAARDMFSTMASGSTAGLDRYAK